MAYCGNCGAKLTVLPPWGRRNSPTYVCPVKAQGGCGTVSMVAPPLETLIRDAVFEALDSPILSETLRAAAESERDRNLLQLLRDDQATLEQLAHDHYILRERVLNALQAALQAPEPSLDVPPMGTPSEDETERRTERMPPSFVR